MSSWNSSFRRIFVKFISSEFLTDHSFDQTEHFFLVVIVQLLKEPSQFMNGWWRVGVG